MNLVILSYWIIYYYYEKTADNLVKKKKSGAAVAFCLINEFVATKHKVVPRSVNTWMGHVSVNVLRAVRALYMGMHWCICLSILIYTTLWLNKKKKQKQIAYLFYAASIRQGTRVRRGPTSGEVFCRQNKYNIWERKWKGKETGFGWA